MNMLVSDDDLKKWTGLRYTKEIELWLYKHKINYIKGKGRKLCTTVDAINKILLGSHSNIEYLDFDL